MSQHILIERSDGLARLTLNKPPLNVIGIPLMQELRSSLDLVRRDSATKVLVLAAQGKFFSAGVDVQDHTPERVGEMLGEFHAVIRALWEIELPTVAAVQGSALGGGCELAMSCDFVVASSTAKFGQPEIQVGAFPPIAALMLSHLVPEKKALEMILTGDPIDAATAERWGLANVVAEPENFQAAVDDFVVRLTRLSGAILKLAKRAAWLGRRTSAAALKEIEEIYLGDLMKTEDAKEGIAAFLEKRRPFWRDR